MDRRKFLTGCAAIGVGVGTAAYSDVFYRALSFEDAGKKTLSPLHGNSAEAEWKYNPKTKKYTVNPDYMIRNSTCLQCHSECGIRAKVHRKTGKLERLQGNPYHPNTLIEYTNTETPLAETANAVGTICARGNSGVQTAYDPYRLTVPLKRTGPRGSNKWMPVEWETFIKEVVNGGNIFDDMNDPASKGLKVKGFKDLYQKRDQWIDDNNHDLGRETNKFVIQSGRIVKSRKDFQDRFARSFGTINSYEHTNICELSHHIATGAVYNGHSNVKADICEAEYLIYWGTAPGEANFPMQTMGKYSAEARVKGCKIVVIDPVLPRTITNNPNMTWLAPKPGTDGAIAMGMINWIITHERYNKNYLTRPNTQAAKQAGELSFSDATHLIITESGHKNEGKFITVKEAGLGQSSDRVVLDTQGQFNSALHCDEASLLFSGKVNGIEVKSSFQLIKESAQKQTLEQYALDSGLDARIIASLADQFTSHGRKAATEFYRGIAQHPNGYHTGFAINQLNVLIGNLNWTGGATLGGGGYDYNNGLYPLSDIPNLEQAQFGMRITREKGWHYEDSVEFKNKLAKGENPYPAKRPWFPFGKDIFSDILPSIIQQYPYNCDILMWHMCTPFYSTPGMGREEIIKAVSDPKVVPLIIASDIVVGDTSMYADYIIPDLTYLEQHVHHPMMEATMVKGIAVRHPVMKALTGKTKDGHYFSFEQFLIDVAKELNMAGFGENAIKDNAGNLYPLNKMEDYYLKATANLAATNAACQEITKEDLHISGLDQFYSEYKDSLPANEWLKALYVMSRGGLFEPVANRRDGEQISHQYTGMLSTYNEKVAAGRNSQTGERFTGYATWQVPTTILGKDVASLDASLGMDFTILTRKTALQSHSRLSSNTYLREIQPTNWAEINMESGKKLGLKTGDRIVVESAEGKRECEVKLREGVAPNVISFSIGFGHWGYGATDIDVGGKRVKGSKIRAAGVNLNPIMRTDPDVWGMPLMDPIGGSSCFFNTKAKIYKV